MQTITRHGNNTVRSRLRLVTAGTALAALCACGGGDVDQQPANALRESTAAVLSASVGRIQSSSQLVAAAGGLDPSFDSDGKQQADFAGLNDEAHGIAVHAGPLLGGKIVVGGGQLAPAIVALNAVTAFAGNCPEGLRDRTPEQVLDAHFGALLSGDVDLIACDYEADAQIITGGSIIEGIAGVKAFFTQIYTLMSGPASLGVVSLTVSSSNSGRNAVALLEWTLDSPHLEVGDGTDTIVIKNGKIQHQTVKLGQLIFK
jgi:hypothetical protein